MANNRYGHTSNYSQKCLEKYVALTAKLIYMCITDTFFNDETSASHSNVP